MHYNDQVIDVICQHTKDGKIIPLRIKLQDEEGVYREYNVMAYKEINSPKGNVLGQAVYSFICRIMVYDTIKEINIIYLVNRQQFIYRPERK